MSEEFLASGNGKKNGEGNGEDTSKEEKIDKLIEEIERRIEEDGIGKVIKEDDNGGGKPN